MVSGGLPVWRRGVALVDALAAVIILGVSLSVILSLAGQAVSSQRQGDDLATAAMLADEQLQMVLARGADDYAKTMPMAGTCDAPFDRFGFKMEITEGSAINPFRVRATISWENAGKARSITIETLVASRTTPANQSDRVPTGPVDRQAVPSEGGTP
jgi:hypothetical protein